jgi:SecD/SecF fusion protein
VSLDKSSDRITVELPGIKSPKRARRLLQATANLEFWELYTAVDLLGQTSPGPIIRLNDELKKNPKYNDKAKDQVKPDSATLAKIEAIKNDTALSQIKRDSQIALLNPSNVVDSIGPLFKILIPSNPQDVKDPFIAYAKSADTAAVMALLNSEEAKGIIPRDLRFAWAAKSDKNKETGVRSYILFALNTKGNKKATLSGERITSTSVSTTQRGGLDYAVSVNMDKEGTRLWKKMTEENVGKSVAVVLDDKVQSWPRVNEVIPNGSTQISGNFTAADANELSNMLSIGKLPATTEL